jgi:phosphate transport system substrate-binding protein
VRRRIVVLAAVGAALLAVGSPAVPAGAAGATVTVTPATGLGNGQFVKVAWSGVTPLQVVFFRQCTLHPTSVSRDCTPIYSDVGFTDGTGSGLLYEHVSVGDVKAGSGTFRCDINHPCSFGLFTDGTLGTGSFANLAFAPTPDGCPTPSGAAISGGGADQANLAIYQWELNTCRSPSLLGVNYIPANSLDGMANFVNGLNDFAVTSLPFTSDQLAQLKHAGRTFTYAPLTTSGLVLAYKVFDQDAAHSEPGAQVTDLKLTPELVTRIFTGQLTNWHVDPEINALNPGHIFPPAVRPLVRGDHSAANLLFTSWLTADGGSALPSDWPGASADYPLKYLVQDSGIVGGDKLADAIADPKTQNLNTDYFSVGYMGFIDASQAAYFGLPVARIENAAGQFVDATPTTIDAALSHATTNSDGVTVSPNFADTDPNDYPMPIVDYATVPTNKVYSGRGITMRSFFDYAASDGQAALPAGYAPLTDAMKRALTAAAATIPQTTAPPPGGGGTYPGGGTGPVTTPSTTPPVTSPAALGGGLGSPPPPGGGLGSTAPTPTCEDGAEHAPHGAPKAVGRGGAHVAAPTTALQPCETAPVDLPAAALASARSRLLLPAIAGLSVLGILGGLALLAGGTGKIGQALTLRPRWRP